MWYIVFICMSASCTINASAWDAYVKNKMTFHSQQTCLMEAKSIFDVRRKGISGNLIAWCIKAK